MTTGPRCCSNTRIAASPARYWRLVGELYSLYLTPRAFREQWMQIFSAPRTGHDQLMTKEEFDAFTDLPFSIEVMRGFAHDGGEVGFSWTRSLAVAEHFAREAATYPEASTPRIAYGTVAKESVIGVLLGRGQNEIIAMPHDVSVTRIEPVAAP